MAAENKAARKSQAAVVKNPAPVTRESAERAMVQSQKQARTTAIAVGAVCALAILLILVALIAPVIMYIVNPYRGYKSVIARFNLSNGMKLEFVIEEDKYDTAATNFIFLATNGFFDNTVFYDAQNGWLRFGGYEAQPATNSQGDYGRTHHRRDSEAYCRGFKALANSQFTGDNRKITDKFKKNFKKFNLMVLSSPVNCGISSASVADNRKRRCKLGNCPMTVAISSWKPNSRHLSNASITRVVTVSASKFCLER